MTSYLYAGIFQWSLSPSFFDYNYAHGETLTASGYMYGNTSVADSVGVRPSVSLKLGTLISGGDGTVESPYVVK